MSHCNYGTDSKVWMEEEIEVKFILPKDQALEKYFYRAF